MSLAMRLSRPLPSSNPAVPRLPLGATPIDTHGSAVDETRLERLAKLIPADVLTVYVAAIGLGSLTTWSWYPSVVAIGCTTLVPILLYLDARPTGHVPVMQYVIRTLAFVAWAFAISQPLAPWVVSPLLPALVALLLPVIGERLIR